MNPKSYNVWACNTELAKSRVQSATNREHLPILVMVGGFAFASYNVCGIDRTRALRFGRGAFFVGFAALALHFFIL